MSDRPIVVIIAENIPSESMMLVLHREMFMRKASRPVVILLRTVNMITEKMRILKSLVLFRRLGLIVPRCRAVDSLPLKKPPITPRILIMLG